MKWLGTMHGARTNQSWMWMGALVSIEGWPLFGKRPCR